MAEIRDLSISEMDSIGVTSGLFTLAKSLLHAAKTLHHTIDSFESHSRAVRELKVELEALSQVSLSLQMSALSCESDLVALRTPLLLCGKACEDFQASLTNFKQLSG